MINMNFRHEFKHEIGYCDMLALRSRLSAVMQQDPNAINGRYKIRSLYFDNPDDKALLEKVNGVDRREKFRLQCYNGDTSLIFLEKKIKVNGLCAKEQTVVDREQAMAIVNGNDFDNGGNELLKDFRIKTETLGLRPKTIVDYVREPFVFPVGNVRVTMDYNIRTGMNCTDFFNSDCVTVPAGEAPIILEVKWNEVLPSLIRDIVQIPSTRTSAFSKYAACRVYG